MFVQFPSLASIHLALEAGAVPASIASKGATASAALDGPVAVRPMAKLSAQAQQALARFGATLVDETEKLEFTAACWPQLLPLRQETKEEASPRPGVAVLFVLADSAALGELIGEILRLGNDRQSYRLLRRQDGGEFAILRVVDPPYYALLRAIEAGDGDGRVIAYIERAPGVWIEVGYRHPLEKSLRPAKGEWLLLRPARDWSSLPAGALHDVYAGLEFKLPAAREKLKESKLAQPIRVPLRLAKTTGHREAATLWVVRDDFAAVNELVHHADDGLLSRLSFAVGEAPGDGGEATRAGGKKRPTTIVLRARPSRETPPVLELGVDCYPFLKLPNLFLPCATRLHPPLRRDTVAELLAPDKSQIVWLYPGPGGAFEVESLPDDAFRPLSEWVEYVFDRDSQALDAWRASCQFDFASFVVEEPRERPILLEHEPAARQLAATMPAAEPKTIAKATPSRSGGRTRPKSIASNDPPLAPPPSFGASAMSDGAPLEERLREAETAYRESAAAHDSAERASIWRQIGELNAQLGRRHEAMLAWSCALWNAEERRFTGEVKAAWLANERMAAESDVAAIERIASLSDPTAAEAGFFAAWLIAREESSDSALAAKATRFMELHQARLPIRVAWLAWQAVARLGRGDVLALARARDRLLAQLHQFGLRPTHDLPSLVRCLSGVDSQRVRDVRGYLARLQPAVDRWLAAAPSASARTGDYAALLFACALARIGDGQAAQAILEQVRLCELSREKPLARTAHLWLRDAFAFRFEQARSGDRAVALPESLAQRLAEMKRGGEKPAAYAIERLRESLALFEPPGHSPSAFLAYFTGPPAKEPIDAAKIETLLETADDDSAALGARHAALGAALDNAAHVGERVAVLALASAEKMLAEKELSLAQQAATLGRTLLLAAHFGDGQRVAALAAMIEQRLSVFIAAYLDDPRRHSDAAAQNAAHEAIAEVETLFSRALSGMRRLGQTEAILRIVRAMEGAAEQAGDRALATLAPRAGGKEARDLAATRLLTLKLHVAEAYFSHAELKQALAILASVRQVLVEGDITPLAKTNLLCRYARAWGRASLEDAAGAIDELFQISGDPPRRSVAPMEERHKRLRSEDDYFSLLDLRAIDAALQAIVGDEFLLSPETRRWLDEDEFSIRRRIHLDVQNAIA